MILIHHSLVFEDLKEKWRAEADMVGFVASRSSYRVDPNAFPGRKVYEVLIKDIGPVQRTLSTGPFNDDKETGLSAKERVINILRGFRGDVAIPPVEVVKLPQGSPYKYKLTHGTHRLYCSLATGFTHVPAVDGFDWEILDQ